MRILKAKAVGIPEMPAKTSGKVQKALPFAKVFDAKRKEAPASLIAAAGDQLQGAAGRIASKEDLSIEPAAPNIELLAAEIIHRLSASEMNGTRKIEIQFNSQTLSGLRVNLQSQGGVISVNFLTNVTGVSELLNKNLGNLRDALERTGIRVAHLRVSGRTRETR